MNVRCWFETLGEGEEDSDKGGATGGFDDCGRSFRARLANALYWSFDLTLPAFPLVLDGG